MKWVKGIHPSFQKKKLKIQKIRPKERHPFEKTSTLHSCAEEINDVVQRFCNANFIFFQILSLCNALSSKVKPFNIVTS